MTDSEKIEYLRKIAPKQLNEIVKLSDLIDDFDNAKNKTDKEKAKKTLMGVYEIYTQFRF